MSSENMNHLINEFEKEIWLYMDGDLPESRKKFWEDKIEQVPELLNMLNETKQALNVYNSTVLTDVDDRVFEKMLNKATRSMSLLQKFKSFTARIFSSKEGNEQNIHKIAFGGILVIAAMVIFLLTEKPNPVKTISSDVLDWDATVISEQLIDINNSLSWAKDEKMREFILYKQTSDEWTRSVSTIEQRIDQLNEEIDDKSL
jgi:hypothetical protein